METDGSLQCDFIKSCKNARNQAVKFNKSLKSDGNSALKNDLQFKRYFIRHKYVNIKRHFP